MRHKMIALVGQPNSGKSTLFNVLSDIKASTSNFAGTTVAIKESLINIGFQTYRLIDLPGLYSLNPVDKAEEVTVQFLLENDVDLIINVVDSTLLSRSIELTIELIELGIPMVVALNLQDEARRYGVSIDGKRLEKILATPVIKTTGLFGKGVKELIEKADSVVNSLKQITNRPKFSHHIEESITKVEKLIRNKVEHKNISPFFYAVKLIENPGILGNDFDWNIDAIINDIHVETKRLHRQDTFEAIASERHHIAMKLTHNVSEITKKKNYPFVDKIDNWLLHPFWGYLFMALFAVLYFVTIFHVGNFITGLTDPVLQKVPSLYESLSTSSPFLWLTVDGIWQGFAGAIGIVLPYFLPLLILTSLFEDTGYMARIAFLLDGLFHKIGLHGKSVAPFILGIGCTVPAIYATRIIDNRRDRLITGILLNFIPCSARLTVIFALSAAFTGPFWTAGILLFVIIVIGINGKILSHFMSKPTGLVMEVPTLKLPGLHTTYKKTYYQVREFIRTALPLLIVGSIVLGWLEYFSLSNIINSITAPLVDNILGLPEQLGSTLLFGFLRKELIIVMSTQVMGVHSVADMGLSVNQAITFTIFLILYIPCIATFGVLWKEFGKKAVLMTAVFTLSMAVISAVFVRYMLLLLGVL